MAGVIADPEKLRRFAAQLMKASEQLDQVSRQLNSGLQQTGWNDRERAKFEKDFQTTVRSITMFSQRIRSEYAPELKRKAAVLDQFKK